MTSEKEQPDLEKINMECAPTWDLLQRDLAQSEDLFLADHDEEEVCE